MSLDNNVLYIYYDEKDKIEGSNIKSLYFDLTVNSLKIKAKCKNIFRTQLKEFMVSNDITAFDAVFNISLPINGSDVDYNTSADLNTFYFEQFVLNDKIGLDRTYFYSLDDKDTFTQFSVQINKLIAASGGREIDPEAIGGSGKIIPKIKVSENVGKITTPGFKQVYRMFDKVSNKAIADLVTLHDEVIDTSKPYEIFHPLFTWKRKTVNDFYVRPLLIRIFEEGKQVYESPSVHEIRDYARKEINFLWQEVKRFENPHEYFVDLSYDLWSIKDKLLKENK